MESDEFWVPTTFVFNIIYLIINLHSLIFNNGSVYQWIHQVPKNLTTGFHESVQAGSSAPRARATQLRTSQAGQEPTAGQALSDGVWPHQMGVGNRVAQVVLLVKTLPTGDTRVEGSISGSERFPDSWEWREMATHWYSCLKNPMDRGAWRATLHGVAKSWTQLKQLSTARMQKV